MPDFKHPAIDVNFVASQLFHAVSVVSADSEYRAFPLLLLHGAGSNHLVWPPKLRRQKNRMVLAPDWPGHGSTHGPGLADIEEFARAAFSIADGAGVDRFVVAGHSLGSAVALQMALDAPDRVAGVIVVAGGARLPVSTALLALLQDDPAKAAERIVRWSYGPHTTETTREKALRFMLKMNPETLYRAFEACSRFDVTARLHELAMPVLILAGAEDRMTPPALAKELHAAYARSRLVVLSETGHMIPIERPGEIATVIGDW